MKEDPENPPITSENHPDHPRFDHLKDLSFIQYGLIVVGVISVYVIAASCLKWWPFNSPESMKAFSDE